MSDISPEYSDDKDIAPYDDNMQDSDGFAAQSREEYDDRAKEGPIDTDEYYGDGQSVSSSSDTGESNKVASMRGSSPRFALQLQVHQGRNFVLFSPKLYNPPTRQNSCVYSGLVHGTGMVTEIVRCV